MKKTLWFLIGLWLASSGLALYFDLLLSGEMPSRTDYALVAVDMELEFLRPEWLNANFQHMLDEVDVFIGEDECGGAQCCITRLGDIYVNTFGPVDRWTGLKTAKACIAHEVGHWVDQQEGYPSGTDEFRDAVDLAAIVDWGISNWPCINGNDCASYADGIEWGGYGELYADLFERRSIGDIPAILWDWYLPYYYMESE